MLLALTWEDIAVRLALALLAGAAIGYDREATGHTAGLRTTIIVCLAATTTMIQANLLLGTVGKASDSFVNIDVMRLPLGVLTGVGFIGAGAILRRGDRVMGVTTAATLWYVTAIGLVLGAGELILGIVATIMGAIVLSGGKWVERVVPRIHIGHLTITAEPGIAIETIMQEEAKSQKFDLRHLSYVLNQDGTSEAHYAVRWSVNASPPPALPWLTRLRDTPGITSVRWTPPT